MWILASRHGTNSPSIQIFSDSVIGIGSNPFCDGVADLGGGARVLTGIFDGFGDAGGGIALAEELEHERGRPYRGDRVGPARADDVGRRAVDGLEQGRTGAGRVEVAGGSQPDTA